MKACINCKHCWELSALIGRIPPGWQGPRCVHPARRKEDPVYGTTLPWRECRTARSDATDCGPDARMFEPTLRHRIATILFGSKTDD